MKKVIVELRAQVTTGCAGVDNYDAEARTADDKYVWVSYGNGAWTYVVANESTLDAINEGSEQPEYIEGYTVWDGQEPDEEDGDPQESEYAEVFDLLQEIIEKID